MTIEIPRASARRRLRLLVRVARQAKPKLAIVIGTTLVLASIAGALQSLAMKTIINAAVDRNWTTAAIAAIAVGVGAGLLGTAGRVPDSFGRPAA